MIHVIVADSRTLRVFERTPSAGPLEEVADWRNPAGFRHDRDLDADRPGSTAIGSSGMHHGYEPTVPSREWAKRRWLKSLAPSLKELLDQRGNESLILVAAPRMLSQLRLCLPSALRKRIRMEVPRDLAGQTAPSISARLRPTLSSLLRTVRVPDWRRVTGVSSGRTVRHH